VLAKTHVVDAGAKGFVYFLEGILEFFTKGFIHDEVVEDVESEEDIFATQDLHEEITFRFCTEALIEGEKIDKKRLAAAIEKKGDSMVVAGSPTKTRVHIHSDHPADVFHILQGFGEITYEKVEDMVMQHEILHNRKSKIALLTDSTCDLPHSLIDHHQIHVMPLYVHFGETHFLDRLTIQPPQFYSMLEKSERNPSSSQPSTQDFINRYEYLSTHYDSIIGLHLTAAMSGTFSNSSKSAEDVAGRTGKKIHLFNTKTLTGGLGLIVLRVAKAIEEGRTVEEILPKIDEWIAKSHIRVTVPTLKYIIRSGRVSPFKSFVARLLDLKPVIAVDAEGKSYMFSKSFTTAGSMKKVVKNLSRMLKGKKIWEYAIMHANNPEAAEWYAARMEEITGRKPCFIDHVSPVLAANTGEGVVGIAIMLE